MNQKPPLTREERLARDEKDAADRASGMRDYRDEQTKTDANTVRLRALRLAKEADDAAAKSAAAAKPKALSPARRKKSV